MWLESEPGVGTTFYFTVRLRSAEESGPPAASSLPEVLQDLRVLIVEDNEASSRALRDLLQLWRMSPEIVFSGSEALELVREADKGGRPFQLVLLDCKLPDYDGLDLAQGIHALSLGDRPHLLLLASAARVLARTPANIRRLSVG